MNMITRKNWQSEFKKITHGTPRDKKIEAFIIELIKSIDSENTDKK